MLRNPTENQEKITQTRNYHNIISGRSPTKKLSDISRFFEIFSATSTIKSFSNPLSLQNISTTYPHIFLCRLKGHTTSSTARKSFGHKKKERKRREQLTISIFTVFLRSSALIYLFLLTYSYFLLLTYSYSLTYEFISLLT